MKELALVFRPRLRWDLQQLDLQNEQNPLVIMPGTAIDFASCNITLSRCKYVFYFDPLLEHDPKSLRTFLQLGWKKSLTRYMSHHFLMVNTDPNSVDLRIFDFSAIRQWKAHLYCQDTSHWVWFLHLYSCRWWFHVKVHFFFVFPKKVWWWFRVSRSRWS